MQAQAKKPELVFGKCFGLTRHDEEHFVQHVLDRGEIGHQAEDKSFDDLKMLYMPPAKLLDVRALWVSGCINDPLIRLSTTPFGNADFEWGQSVCLHRSRTESPHSSKT